MSGLGRVCERCNGRGRVYRGHGLSNPCPTCGGAGPKRAGEQLEAVHRLQACHKRLLAGETAPLNLELAVRMALATGLSLEALHRRAGVPMAQLRAAASGQLGLA